MEPVAGALAQGTTGLRVAVAGGYFARGGEPDCFAAVARAAEASGASRTIEIPEAARARAAAFLITASEAAGLHLDRLRERPGDYDPAVRDRLIAGTTIPAAWVHRAQRFRSWYRARVLALFDEVDVILAPCTPCRALRIGQATMELDGVTVPARPNIGVFTQPISFIGLPVVAVPVRVGGGLPLAVQVIAAPWREDLALRVAGAIEAAGVGAAPVAG